MRISDQHKAILITLLLCGTVVLSLFNVHLSQKGKLAQEVFYDMEPEPLTPEEEEKIFEVEEQDMQEVETNKAFNQTKKYSQFAQAYKPIAPPEDYEYKPAEESEVALNSGDASSKNDALKNKQVDKKDLSKFDKINELLNKKKSIEEESANTKSTIYYSLVGRTDLYLPVPIYLCERGGKVVVNISVNAAGEVTEAYINGSSTSANECLHDHALEYAKQAEFNVDASKPKQLGTITFHFIGKRR